MSINVGELKSVTPEEFEAMEKDERLNYELIDGIVMMSPSPTFEHQAIGSRLIRHLGNALAKTSCIVIHEYDIKFQSDVYKPDVAVFCEGDNESLPEIVVEVLSPSTRQRDLLVKLFKSQAMGIKEYWIIDPKVKIVTVHDFINQTAETYGLGDTIQSNARPEIIIAAADIFA